MIDNIKVRFRNKKYVHLIKTNEQWLAATHNICIIPSWQYVLNKNTTIVIKTIHNVLLLLLFTACRLYIGNASNPSSRCF